MALDLKNMDKKKLGIIVGALASGLVAMILMNNYIEDTMEKRTALLKQGASKEDVQQVMQRVQRLEQGNQQLIANMRQLAAQKAAPAPAPKDAPQKVEPKRAPSLSLTTPPGKRAITINIDKLSAVGGLINPGDFVDIIVHLNVPLDPFNEKKVDKVMVTLFQNVQVLAIGTSLLPAPEGVTPQPATPTITFAFSPQEASLMSFAEKHGKFQLILRPPAERQSYALPAVTWETLSEYVLSTQGVDIGLWGEKQEEEEEEAFPDEAELPPLGPPIQIFRGR